MQAHTTRNSSLFRGIYRKKPNGISPEQLLSFSHKEKKFFATGEDALQIAWLALMGIKTPPSITKTPLGLVVQDFNTIFSERSKALKALQKEVDSQLTSLVAKAKAPNQTKEDSDFKASTEASRTQNTEDNTQTNRTEASRTNPLQGKKSGCLKSFVNLFLSVILFPFWLLKRFHQSKPASP
ncbi:MAG: hypothetical protein K2X01_11945 [Cyanobacteria bacterium]|nr:hypothetical protein [Cyanobacteriota bacterium]